MSGRKIWTRVFSPTGNAYRIAARVALRMSVQTGGGLDFEEFTLPEERGPGNELKLGPEDHLVIVLPVYAGRLPNKILPWVQEGFKGEGTTATAIVTFGNRNCDSALGELKAELEMNGFRVTSAAAVVSEHVFSDKLAKGRPDAIDMQMIDKFAADSVKAMDREDALDIGARTEVGPYYVPKRADGEPAKFLKAKPVRDDAACIRCDQCALVCPMGSISKADTSQVPGICIKCQACIKVCPKGARRFTDEDFLSHRDMLIENFTRPAKNEFYI